jgi:hypothetical protein
MKTVRIILLSIGFIAVGAFWFSIAFKTNRDFFRTGNINLKRSLRHFGLAALSAIAYAIYAALIMIFLRD